jgi:hypothetical protein
MVHFHLIFNLNFTYIKRSLIASLIDWANAHNDEYRTTNFWPTILASITDVMKPIIEHSVYHRYNFDLDYTVMIDGVHIAERGKQIDDLVENDMFLYALLTVSVRVVACALSHITFDLRLMVPTLWYLSRIRQSLYR